MKGGKYTRVAIAMGGLALYGLSVGMGGMLCVLPETVRKSGSLAVALVLVYVLFRIGKGQESDKKFFYNRCSRFMPENLDFRI